MFCHFCGTAKEEGQICPNCGNGDVNNTESSNNNNSGTSSFNFGSSFKINGDGTILGFDPKNPVSSAKDMDKKKLAILIGGAIIVLAIVFSILGALFGGGPKKPINDYIRGAEKGNYKQYMSAFSKEAQKALKEWVDKDDIKEMKANLRDEYGKNVKVRIKYGEKTKLKKDDLRDLEDFYEDYYDKKIKITAAYEYDIVVKYKGRDGSDETELTLTVAKIRGQGWKLVN